MPFWTVLTSQLWDLSCGHEAYLFGRYSTEGWWYYFPIAFLVKTPVPTLLLGFWGVMTLVRDDARRWDHGLLLLPPSAFFIIGGFIWVLRSFKTDQVEEE